MQKLLAFILALLPSAAAFATERPNILWITCEDISPNLGCYGDGYSVTPNLDALAAKGMRYTNAISNAPVCAAARTTIISGLYSPSLGAEHMRSFVNMPATFRMFPQYLRDAGYYATNNSKEDYNLEQPGQVWDVSSGKAHWKNRRKGQPFFAVFNHIISHESQIRNKIEDADRIHDPAKARVPAYHPDTPEVRRDWAQYYDRITMMDTKAGANLRELAKAGLADDTIVFFFSDHGSGMPRSKRSACNSGLNVPFIVYFPPKWRHLAPKDYREGGTSDRLISFVDLAPTVLSLAGIQAPEWMQGVAFCGKYEAAEPEFSFGFRGRMDERIDLVRSVRDKRYMYVRNYMPYRPHGQHNAYMFETSTTRVWYQLFEEGKLNAAQAAFWQPKEVEELYDFKADPDEVHNLANLPENHDVLLRMREAQEKWEKRIKDVDFLSEWEMHARSKGSSPYEVGHDPKKYDFDAIFAAANTASSMDVSKLPAIAQLLTSNDAGVRYWGAVGLLSQGKYSMKFGEGKQLFLALNDESPIVRVVAAEALGRLGTSGDAVSARQVLLKYCEPSEDAYLTTAAWNSLDYLDERANPAKAAIRALSPDPKDPPPRYGGYGRRLKEQTLVGLQ